MQDQKAQSSKTGKSADSQTMAKTFGVFFKPWESQGWGAFLTHAMLPTASAGLDLFKEWRAFARESAEAMQLNMSTAADGLQHLAGCKTPVELGEATADVTRSLTSQWLRTNQKLADLAVEYAGTRMEKTGKWALTTLRQVDG